MTKKEIIAQIELMNEWERVIEEAKAEVEAIKDSIKAEMADRRMHTPDGCIPHSHFERKNIRLSRLCHGGNDVHAV